MAEIAALLATNPASLTQVLGVVYRTIARHSSGQAGLTRTRAATGALARHSEAGWAGARSSGTCPAYRRAEAKGGPTILDSQNSGSIYSTNP